MLSIAHRRNNLKDSSTESVAFKGLKTRRQLTKVLVACNGLNLVAASLPFAVAGR